GGHRVRGGVHAPAEGQLDGRAAQRAQRRGGVHTAEVVSALVDRGEHQAAAQLGGEIQVDVEVLAGGAGAGAVVLVEADERRAVEGAEGAVKRAHRADPAVGQLEEAAQVQVEAAAAAPA